MINAAGLEVSGSNNPNWKGGKIIKVCARCGCDFSVKPGYTHAKYCCIECWNKEQKDPSLPRVHRPRKPRAIQAIMDPSLRLSEKSRLAPDGCVEWIGRLSSCGYGQLTVRKKYWLAHRLKWSLAKGPIPVGLCVLHKCDNRKCINIDHLFIGTQADNVADMIAKGRANLSGLRKSAVAVGSMKNFNRHSNLF